MEHRFRTTRHPVYVNVRPNAISVMLDEADVFTFDRSGRLLTAVVDDHTFKRGLDGRVLHKWREKSAGHVAWLGPSEARNFVEEVYARIRACAGALFKGRPETAADLQTESFDELSQALAHLGRLGANELAEDVRRFASVYQPLAILPPDQYLALVLQVTEGCHYNRCSFCNLYRDRTFRIKTVPELESHAAALREYLGPGISLRRSIFLADANALLMPRDRLLPVLDSVNRSFGDLGRTTSRRIFSFADIFSRDERTECDYAELRERNVTRLYLGVETGCRDLLRFLRKPQTPAQTLETVAAMKRGGLNVGVMIMLGIGGETYSRAHVEETAALLNSFPWSGGDMVFLSPLQEYPHVEYASLAAEAGIKPLSPRAISEQYSSLRTAIKRTESYPRVAPYNGEEFIY